MTGKTLIELRCAGCEKEFYVHLVEGVLCHECQVFKTAMDELMRPRVWEKSKVNWPLYRGLGIGLLLMSSLLGACWYIVGWLR